MQNISWCAFNQISQHAQLIPRSGIKACVNTVSRSKVKYVLVHLGYYVEMFSEWNKNHTLHHCK